MQYLIIILCSAMPPALNAAAPNGAYLYPTLETEKTSSLVQSEAPEASDDADGQSAVEGQPQRPPGMKPKEFFRAFQDSEFRAGVLYVRFVDTASAERREAAHANAGATEILWESRWVSGLVKVAVPEGQELQSVHRYLDDPDVWYAEPQYALKPDRIPNDPRYGELWAMPRIRAPQVWDFWVGTRDLRVAVLDSGIQADHTDLWPNLWTNPGEIPGNGIDDDGNNYVDDIHGWNTCANNGDTEPAPECNHGLHVAGTVGAHGNNGRGITGVAWDVSLVSIVHFSGNGNGQCPGCGDAVAGLEYALDNGIRVSVNSYGSAYNQSFYDTIKEGQSIGHIFVASAGNGGPDYEGDDNDITPHYPSSYDLDNVIAVASHTDFGNFISDFSNYGVDSVDLAAPGEAILSTVYGHEYEIMHGTSMATPHVAGVAALLYSRFPYLTYKQVRDRILGGVTHEDSYSGKLATSGRLDAARPMGIWVQYGYFGFEFGTWAEPYSSIPTALPHVPPNGHLFLRPATTNFTGTLSSPMFLEPSGGVVTIGKQ
ncbi:MAG: hypothetical protein FLDDKLPJ_02655 [Phycisphaerae bacterium]|nr:hypothetical protein [Phycisphaerae bacterium]